MGVMFKTLFRFLDLLEIGMLSRSCSMAPG
jgi:hypothetical protein